MLATVQEDDRRHPRLPPPALAAAVAAAVVLLGGYGALVAWSRPFTDSADLLTAIPFGVLGAVLVATLLRRRRGVQPGADRRAYGPWALALGAFCCWELVTYFAGNSARHAWPTVSSLVDTAFEWGAVKGVIFLFWLGLGWGLVRR
jgi:hypothetical protein